MRRLPPLPDLGKLTDAQKDELIVSLWETLVAIEGSGGASRPAGAAAVDQAPSSTAAPLSTDELRARIRRTPPSRRAQAPLTSSARFGGGFDFLESKIAAGSAHGGSGLALSPISASAGISGAL